MIHAPVCDLLPIRHPILLGGMAGHTSAPPAAAVSSAGGLGTLGIGRTPAEQIPKAINAVRETTKQAFGVKFLLFDACEPAIDAALTERPPVFAAAWALADQDLTAIFARAHDVGSVVMLHGRHGTAGSPRQGGWRRRNRGAGHRRRRTRWTDGQHCCAPDDRGRGRLNPYDGCRQHCGRTRTRRRPRPRCVGCPAGYTLPGDARITVASEPHTGAT